MQGEAEREEAVAIRAEGLTKVFGGGVRAVSDLSLEVGRAAIFGFLGPNGAGKTTTVRLLNGTLTPSAGSSTVLGLSSGAEEVRRRTSTLAELAQMYEHMSVQENLRFYAELYDLEAGEAERRIGELLERMEATELRAQKLGTLSTGMRKRVALARTLLHRPRIVFLDEPTAGLDPGSALQVTELIRSLAREEQTTIFMCTHNLFLAERICDTFGFIRQGRLVAAGDKERLIAGRVENPSVKILTDRGGRTVAYRRVEEINAAIQETIARGEHILEVRPVRPTLEEVYFHYIGAPGKEGQ